MQQVNKIRLFTPSQVLTDSSFCLSIHVFTKNGWFYLYIFSLDSWYFFFSLDSLFVLENIVEGNINNKYMASNLLIHIRKSVHIIKYSKNRTFFRYNLPGLQKQ